MKKLEDLTVKELMTYCAKSKCNREGCIFKNGWECELKEYCPGDWDRNKEVDTVLCGVKHG